MTDAPPAGRELDAMVAEKVMGLHACDKWTQANLGSGGGPCWVHGTFDEPDNTHSDCWPAKRGPPEYSTSISAAWEVVEKLSIDNVLITIEVAEGTNWRCIVYDKWSYGKVWSVDAKTAPLAICRAALAAVENSLNQQLNPS